MATVNLWKKFVGLLPGGVRIVGTVAAVSAATGSSTVTLRNGSQITARGVDVAVGSRCFIVDGVITGPAPELPQYDIEV